MSGRYELTPAALADLGEIWRYVAIENRNRRAADRLRDDIESTCGDIARIPSLGHPRKDLTNNSEFLFHCVRDQYLVVYQKDTTPLQILRILHGSRDLSTELRED